VSESDKPLAHKSLWELLWDYDPNGLIVVDVRDPALPIRAVNSAFCRLFQTSPGELLGRPAGLVLDDIEDFREIAAANVVEPGTTVSREREYPRPGIYVRKVLFAIREEGVAACIMVDLTAQWRQRAELVKLRRETIAKANEVADNQMKVAQEIAGLLGETTAATKVSLLRLIAAFDNEDA